MSRLQVGGLALIVGFDRSLLNLSKNDSQSDLSIKQDSQSNE